MVPFLSFDAGSPVIIIISNKYTEIFNYHRNHSDANVVHYSSLLQYMYFFPMVPTLVDNLLT